MLPPFNFLLFIFFSLYHWVAPLSITWSAFLLSIFFFFGKICIKIHSIQQRIYCVFAPFFMRKNNIHSLIFIWSYFFVCSTMLKNIHSFGRQHCTWFRRIHGMGIFFRAHFFLFSHSKTENDRDHNRGSLSVLVFVICNYSLLLCEFGCCFSFFFRCC